MIPEWYKEVFAEYHQRLWHFDHLYIGLSAGIDSNILLNWLHYYKVQLPPITAIHVNHQWHGQDSFIWADFARQSAEKYQFEFINYDVIIDINKKGAEASGREARYIKFAETMQENSALLVAHHRSDQAETVLYRLFRGSGITGLGGIRDVSRLSFGKYIIDIIRPLLSISKAELYKTGEVLGISWMEDYTNHETEEARNQIRNAILPTIAKFFPYYEKTIERSAGLIQEGDTLLREIAKSDCETYEKDARCLRLVFKEHLSALRQRNLLRYWLESFSLILEKRQFDDFFSMFIEKQPTSQSCFSIEHYEVRAFKDNLYMLLVTDEPCQYDFELIEAQNAPPLSFWKTFNLKLEYRTNGMYFHPLSRRHAQSVKKLLQEQQVEPWLRKDTQVLKNENNEVIWIQYLGLNHIYASECISTGYIPKVYQKFK